MKTTKFLFVASLLILASCSSTTEKGSVGVGRSQLLLVPSEQIIAMSAQGYEETKKEAQSKGALDVDKAEYARAVAVSKRLIAHVPTFRNDASGWAWEVHVIKSPELNAYCMPGGKIMFYSGLIETLHLTDAEIAAVMGHEISHALREHGRERMSEELIKQFGLGILQATGTIGPESAGALNALTTVAVTLRHSRGQESEADSMGLELMARAGYNPQEAVNLWKKMGDQGGAKPPEFLSTHPADSTRIHQIESLLPKVMPLYQQSAEKTSWLKLDVLGRKSCRLETIQGVQ